MPRYFSVVGVAVAMLWPAVPSARAEAIVLQSGFFLAVPSEAMSLDFHSAPPAELFGATVQSASLRLFENTAFPPAPVTGTVLQPGDTLDTSRAFQGSGSVFLGFPSPTVGYSLLVPTAVFQFTGSDFIIPGDFPPPPIDDEDLYFVRQPFSMEGFFAFVNPDGTLSLRQITGRGTAFLGLQPVRASGASELVSLGYSFEPDAPVPEPGTLILFGLGALSAIGCRQRDALRR